MTWVVFLRGANVGGHGKFQPKKFAEGMGELGVTNIAAPEECISQRIRPKFREYSSCSILPYTSKTSICNLNEISNWNCGNHGYSGSRLFQIQSHFTSISRSMSI